MILTTLTETEYIQAVHLGVQQAMDALLSRRPGSHGISAADNDSYDLRIRGVIGEYVIAKRLGLPWLSIQNPFSPMDFPGVDVKTPAEIGDPLIIRDNVDASMRLILVTPGINRPLDWIIWGWITAAEGRQVGRRTNFNKPDRETVFAVSHRFLHDLSDLVIPLGVSEDPRLLSTAGH